MSKWENEYKTTTGRIDNHPVYWYNIFKKQETNHEKENGMKKNLFVIACLAIVAATAMGQHLVINEVQYDPSNGGTDTKWEWFELYNPTGDDIDLTGWKLFDNSDSIGEPFPSVVVAAGEYIVFSALVDSFHINFPAVPATQWSDTSIGGAGLSNTADMLVLMDPASTVIDRMNWGPYNATWPSYIRFGCWTTGTIDPAAGHSIGRSPNGYDNDLVGNFADLNPPSPGATNGGAVVYAPHTIFQIQNGGTLTDSTVSVVGIVTSRNITSGAGFMMADAAGAWHGVMVYGTSVDALPGDSVLVNGTVNEFNTLTELVASGVTARGTAAIPAVTNVTLAQIKTGSGTAESFEGVLVRVPKALSCDTVFMTPTYGEWAVCIGPDTLRIDNSSTANGIYYAKPNFGVDSVTVTGVMTYDNGHFKLMPRDSADVINNGPNAVTGQPVAAMPAAFKLQAARPSPASTATVIEYSLQRGGTVNLSVFNMLGQKVASLASGVQAAGAHQVSWSLKNDNGSLVPNGVYFYQLSAGSQKDTRKLIVVR
jgi:hypothetical protein